MVQKPPNASRPAVLRWPPTQRDSGSCRREGATSSECRFSHAGGSGDVTAGTRHSVRAYSMSRTGSPVSDAVHVVVSCTAAGNAKFTFNQQPNGSAKLHE